MVRRYAPSLIYRLGIDPVPEPAVASEREVQIDLVRRPGGGTPEALTRTISWAGMDESANMAVSIKRCISDQVATEDAAIGVMALLVSDLGGAELNSVLPIGTSADYQLEWVELGEEGPLEVSGLRHARSQSDSSGRLAVKTEQILTGNRAGYVSVSTFQYPPTGAVHSYLHFVRRRPGPKAKKKGDKMKSKGTSMKPKPSANPAATVAALEGGAALLRGDIKLAREKHGEAGHLLVQQAAVSIKQSARHMAWFLAATQFYQGGDYKRALQVAHRIEAKFLPANLRESLSEFVRQVEKRASSHYSQATRAAMFRLRQNGRPDQLLRLLQEHPYLFEPDSLAFVRAELCERLGDFRSAAYFFGSAYRFRPLVVYPTMAAGYLFQLTGEERFSEAQEYAASLVKELPHAVVFAAASVVWLLAARPLEPEKREPYFRTQLSLFELSRTAYRDMPAPERDSVDVRDFMLLAYDAAAKGSLWKGDDVATAAEISDEARKYWPAAAELLVSRGLAATSLDEGAIYFQRAVELKATSYTPYYFLAQHAIANQDFAQALSLAREALARAKPGQQAFARLHGFVAACIDYAGGSRAEADAHFRRAMEIDPKDKELKEAYDTFLAESPPPPTIEHSWRTRADAMTDYTIPSVRLREAERGANLKKDARLNAAFK